jgi:hypothetical protein
MVYVHRNLTTFINILFMFQKHDLFLTFQGPIKYNFDGRS